MRGPLNWGIIEHQGYLLPNRRAFRKKRDLGSDLSRIWRAQILRGTEGDLGLNFELPTSTKMQRVNSLSKRPYL
jgi:hypothetical protein